MPKLSDTALVLLNKAAARDDRLVEPPNHLPAAARNAVVRSLLKHGLLIEDAVELNHPLAWRTDESDADLRCSIALRITDDGFRALNLEPPGVEDDDADQPLVSVGELARSMRMAEGDAATRKEASAIADEIEAKPAKKGLREVAQAVVDLWEACDADGTIDLVTGMQPLVADLRAALAKPGRAERALREPRGETKQDQVIAMLKQPEGATNLQIQEATTWAPHTVRGFFAGLKKKGFTILAGKNPETKETVYRIPA